MIQSKSADYGLRALIHLARRPRTELVPLRELSDAIGTPTYFLARVLHRLVGAEILVAKAGRNGGFRLCRDPHQIHVAETVRAIEGPRRSFDCTAVPPCALTGDCRVVALFASAGKAFESVLSHTTIADLVSHSDPDELVAFVRGGVASDSIQGGC